MSLWSKLSGRDEMLAIDRELSAQFQDQSRRRATLRARGYDLPLDDEPAIHPIYCLTCGAAVADLGLHDTWHNKNGR